MSSFCCSIKFDSRNEYLNHVQSTHMKSIRIVIDKGNIAKFTRIDSGGFKCPTCSSICNDIDDVLFHLLCVKTNDSYCSSKVIKLRIMIKNAPIVCKHARLSDEEIQKTKESDYFNFLLTPSSGSYDNDGHKYFNKHKELIIEHSAVEPSLSEHNATTLSTARTIHQNSNSVDSSPR